MNSTKRHRFPLGRNSRNQARLRNGGATPEFQAERPSRSSNKAQLRKPADGEPAGLVATSGLNRWLFTNPATHLLPPIDLQGLKITHDHEIILNGDVRPGIICHLHSIINFQSNT